VQRLLQGWAERQWDTGIAFGTVGGYRRGQTVEITTFRADSYDGASRNPEVVFGDTVEGDLLRRDFTVNAMAIDLTGVLTGDNGRSTGGNGTAGMRFVDPHDGMAAL